MTLRTDIEADWQAIAELDEFTIDARWYDADGMPHDIKGWERKPYSRVDVNSPVEAYQHTLRVMASDVPEIKQGQIIEIATDYDPDRYEIIGVQPDGAGTVLLILSEDE